MTGVRFVAVVWVIALAALAASACGLLCPDEEVFAVDAPDRARRARAVTRGCGQESALAVVLVDGRTGGQTELISSKYLYRVKVFWASASVLQVTIVDVHKDVAKDIIESAVRQVGDVAIEYYLPPRDYAMWAPTAPT